jgi:fatty-acid desaturase
VVRPYIKATLGVLLMLAALAAIVLLLNLVEALLGDWVGWVFVGVVLLWTVHSKANWISRKDRR